MALKCYVNIRYVVNQMNDSMLAVFYIAMVMLPQVLTSALGFVLCRKPPKNIIASAHKKAKRSLAASDAWDCANVKSGKFLCIGGLVCIVLSADFCVVAVSLGWHISAPLPALYIPYGLYGALLIVTVVYTYLDYKKTHKKLKFPAKQSDS